MVVTCEDLIFNEFRMSDYELVSGNGSDGEIDDTENMGLTPTVSKVFTGESPRSTYISSKYESNPVFTVKFTKGYCRDSGEDYFEENELRNFNRLLTGKRGYSWLKIVNSDISETDYYYRAIVSAIEYERLGLHVVGYDVSFELDGGMAYSEKQTSRINAFADTPFNIYCNSDDLHGYTLPVVQIRTTAPGTLTLTNASDNWTSQVTDIEGYGEVLTFDCKNELISTSDTRSGILDDFNLHWPRLLPGKNTYTCSQDAVIEFTFRAARKVGFVS